MIRHEVTEPQRIKCCSPRRIVSLTVQEDALTSNLKPQKLMIIDGIPIEVVRKPIKNMNLRIYAETGKVRVAAPRHYSDALIRRFVAEKSAWIQQKLKKTEPIRALKKLPISFLEGSEQLLFGEMYTLMLKSDGGKRRCRLGLDNTIEMFNTSELLDEQKAKLLLEWKRELLKETVQSLLPKWEDKMDIKVEFLGVKNMKTRWGTCLPSKQRVWLALDLVHKPVECVEYVLVHELVHFFERLHNKRFHGFMSHYLPEWPALKKKLNSSYI